MFSVDIYSRNNQTLRSRKKTFFPHNNIRVNWKHALYLPLGVLKDSLMISNIFLGINHRLTTK